MTELKPCPFCGARAAMRIDYYQKQDMETYFAICANPRCGCRTLAWPTVRQAADVWNRRRRDD